MRCFGAFRCHCVVWKHDLCYEGFHVLNSYAQNPTLKRETALCAVLFAVSQSLTRRQTLKRAPGNAVINQELAVAAKARLDKSFSWRQRLSRSTGSQLFRIRVSLQSNLQTGRKHQNREIWLSTSRYAAKPRCDAEFVVRYRCANESLQCKLSFKTLPPLVFIPNGFTVTAAHRPVKSSVSR